MEFEEKRLFLQVCQFLSYFADKLKEATKQYSLEVLSDSKLLAKRRELMITTILRTVINIFSKCDVLIQNIGRKHFEKLECYNELILFLDVYKKISNKTTDELFHDQCIQTDITNPDAKEFEIDTIVKEEISGYESEETVLIDRDVHLDNVSGLETEREDVHFGETFLNESHSPRPSKGSSYVFHLHVDDDKNTQEVYGSDLQNDINENTSSFFHPVDNLVTTNKEAKPSSSKITEENDIDKRTNSPNLHLCIEHESDFEEDDDYYWLKNDDVRESDFQSSSLNESEEEYSVEFHSSKSDIFSEKDDSDESIQEFHKTRKKEFEGIILKKCVVNIERLPQKVIERCKVQSSSEDEYHNEKNLDDPFLRLKNEIERLSDFKTLKSTKKRYKKLKKQKNIKKLKIDDEILKERSSEEESTSSTSASSSDSNHSIINNTIKSPLQAPIDFEELQYEILENLSGPSDSDSESYSQSSSESETNLTKKHRKRKGSQKEDCERKKYNRKLQKKVAEWRKDNLLRGKLVSDSSSEYDIPALKTAMKRKIRIIYSESDESCNERLSVEGKIKQETDSEKENKVDTVDTKISLSNSTPLYEVTDILTPSPESNSDIEFVKDDGKVISDSDNVEIVEDDIIKRRRRNIRKVLEDANLEEETKKANKEEEAHRQRLFKKKKELESLSQCLESNQVEGLILDFDDITKQTIITVDPILTARLKQHQIEGVRFMWDICYESVSRLKESPGTGCILAHCMGLGKTYQVIVLIHTLFKYPVTNTNHVLIVCPLSTVSNWANEFEFWLKQVENKVNVFFLRKQNVDKIKIVTRWQKKKGVLIIGYEAYERLVRSDKKEILEALVDPGPDLIVCDEGHLIKNEKAIRSQALNRVKTRRRIMLTGTPIQNNLKEYYYMVNFVKPKLLGTYKEYCNRFVNPITNGQYHDSTQHDINVMKKRSHVLHKLLKSTIQRYEVSELEKQIPKKFDYVIFIRSHPLQANLYQQYIKNIRVGETKIFGHYSRLQGILSHPYVLDLKEKNDALLKKNEQKEIEIIDLEPEIKENEPLPNSWWRNFCPEDYKDNLDYGPKIKIMLKIIDECEKIGDKILIFSNSMPEMEAIEYFLKKRTTGKRNWKKGIDYYRMDGTVLPEERNNICDSFNNCNNIKAKVFIISYKVGGLGLNMVAANRVILMDVNWNPSYETQSIFRVYRFGQMKECFVYRLVSMGTIEEVIYQRSVTKLSIAGRVVDERQITRHYKCAELQEMLRFNLNLEETRPIPKPPTDKILAMLLLEMKTEIFKYHEHQALLENRPDEELNEDEMKLAWDEYHQEQIKENEVQKLSPLSYTNGFMEEQQHKQAGHYTTDNCNMWTFLENKSNIPVQQNNKRKANTITAQFPLAKGKKQIVFVKPVTTKLMNLQKKNPHLIKKLMVKNVNLTSEENEPSTSSIVNGVNSLQNNIVEHQVQLEMIQSLKKAYNQFLQKSDKSIEIMTPRIERVFSEAEINNQANDNISEIIDLERSNSITLIPIANTENKSRTDEIIEIK